MINFCDAWQFCIVILESLSMSCCGLVAKKHLKALHEEETYARLWLFPLSFQENFSLCICKRRSLKVSAVSRQASWPPCKFRHRQRSARRCHREHNLFLSNPDGLASNNSLKYHWTSRDGMRKWKLKKSPEFGKDSVKHSTVVVCPIDAYTTRCWINIFGLTESREIEDESINTIQGVNGAYSWRWRLFFCWPSVEFHSVK